MNPGSVASVWADCWFEPWWTRHSPPLLWPKKWLRGVPESVRIHSKHGSKNMSSDTHTSRKHRLSSTKLPFFPFFLLERLGVQSWKFWPPIMKAQLPPLQLWRSPPPTPGRCCQWRDLLWWHQQSHRKPVEAARSFGAFQMFQNKGHIQFALENCQTPSNDVFP